MSCLSRITDQGYVAAKSVHRQIPVKVCLQSLHNHFKPTTRATPRIPPSLMCLFARSTLKPLGSIWRCHRKESKCQLACGWWIVFWFLLPSNCRSGPWRCGYQAQWWRVTQGFIFCLFTRELCFYAIISDLCVWRKQMSALVLRDFNCFVSGVLSKEVAFVLQRPADMQLYRQYVLEGDEQLRRKQRPTNRVGPRHRCFKEMIFGPRTLEMIHGNRSCSV